MSLKLPKILLKKYPGDEDLNDFKLKLNIQSERNSKYKNQDLLRQKRIQHNDNQQNFNDQNYKLIDKQLIQIQRAYSNRNMIKISDYYDKKIEKKIATSNFQEDTSHIKSFKQQSSIINQPQSWKPNSRETFSITNLNNKLFMSCGFGNQFHDDINFFEFENWKNFPCVIQSRSNHVFESFATSLFIFGGRLGPKKQRQPSQEYIHVNENNGKTPRIITNETLVYNLNTFLLQNIKTPDDLLPRLNAMSVQMSRYILVLGGYENKRLPFKDIWSFDMQNLTWRKIIAHLSFQQGTATAIFDRNRRLDTIIHDRKFAEKLQNPYIAHEGVYIFQKQLEILDIVKNKVYQPETFGYSPSERINHAAVYNPTKNFYSIYGGFHKNAFLNDFFVLNIQNLNWIQVEHFGVPLVPRSHHNMIYINNEILVLGGVNFDGYIPLDVMRIQQGSYFIQILKLWRKKIKLISNDFFYVMIKLKNLQILSQDMEKIYKAIQELPTLDEKIRLTAVAKYHNDLENNNQLMNDQITEIEKQFESNYEPIYQAQEEIIQGQRLCTPEELALQSEFLKEGEVFEDNLEPIQGYWAKVFQHCAILKEEVQEVDFPIIQHLTNIKHMKEAGSKNFSLVFSFSSNEFFSNTELRKRFIFDKDEYLQTEGTEINWNEGKNVTVTIVNKKQKNKKTGQTRTIKKEEEAPSFFNFFRDTDVRDETMEAVEDDEEADKLDERHQVAMEIMDQITQEAIPFSLQYFLGIEQPEEDGPEYSDEEMDMKPGKKCGGKHKKSGECC